MVRSGTNMCLYMYIIMSPELSYSRLKESEKEKININNNKKRRR